MGSLLGAADMSGYHSHTPRGAETEPTVEPTRTENTKSNEAGHDELDKPARKENMGAHTPEAGGGWCWCESGGRYCIYYHCEYTVQPRGYM